VLDRGQASGWTAVRNWQGSDDHLMVWSYDDARVGRNDSSRSTGNENTKNERANNEFHDFDTPLKL
jgi:hypothetical protein